MQKYLYILLFAVLSFVQVNGQGWERIYGGSGQDVAKALAATPDGGYVLTGYYNGNTRLYLLKVDADGKLQWSKTFTANQGVARMEGFGVVVTPDNGFAIAGYIDQDGLGPQKRDIYLLKVDAFGEKMWERSYGSSLDDEARALITLPDGCFVLTGYQTFAGSKENVFVLKTDPQGNSLWLNNFGAQGNRKKGLAIALAQNGDVVVAGELQPTITSSKDAYMLRVGTSGNLLKEQTYEAVGAGGATGEDEARALVATNDGNFVFAGFSNIGPGGVGTIIKVDGTLGASPIWQQLYPNNDFYGIAKEPVTGNLFCTGKRTSGTSIVLEDLNILKMTPTGETIWEAIVGRGGLDIGYAVLPTRGGGIAAGFSEQTISPTGESYAYLVRTDSEGKVFTSYIQANIFRDFNNNCQPDVDEPSLRNWIVKFENPYDTRYTVSNSNGDVYVEVDTGQYNLVLFPPNNYWKACDSVVVVAVPNFYDTITLKVPVRSVFDCARNEIDITTPILRRCSDNTYQVRYCNSGSVPSLNTKIQVVLDPMLSYQSSSISVDNILGDTLVFNIGTVLNGECKDFTITAFLDCAVVAGEAHCVNAYISPNDFCDVTSGWDGAIIAARAFCENDTVKMVLENVGTGNMNGPLGYVITEDVIMLTQPNTFSFKLDAGQDSIYWTHPANGSTFRIIAQQSPGYPGTSYPTAAVEGCLSDTSTIEPSYGFYTMFPEDDADPFVETDCQESQETDYNPVRLKRGHPKGYDAAHHYVSPETDLDYLIQFRNTGADTVRQVIIRDTLSAALDPATVYPGASSHPYLFEMYGNGIVQFTLENVNLPPGGGASEGFVKLRVAQKPNLPCGTIIFNSAAIYFDFKAPSMSNTTFHTVCEFDSFIVVTKTKQIFVPNVEVKTYPNPASEYVNFEITGVDAKHYTLQLYDIQGRLIANLFYDNPMFQLYRHQLPAGTLMYRLAADGKPLAAGKLIVR